MAWNRRFVEFINSFDEWVELLQQCVDLSRQRFPSMHIQVTHAVHVFNQISFRNSFDRFSRKFVNAAMLFENRPKHIRISEFVELRVPPVLWSPLHDDRLTIDSQNFR